MWKTRFRNWRGLAQGHTASQGWIPKWTSRFWGPRPVSCCVVHQGDANLVLKIWAGQPLRQKMQFQKRPQNGMPTVGAMRMSFKNWDGIGQESRNLWSSSLSRFLVMRWSWEAAHGVDRVPRKAKCPEFWSFQRPLDAGQVLYSWSLVSSSVKGQ